MSLAELSSNMGHLTACLTAWYTNELASPDSDLPNNIRGIYYIGIGAGWWVKDTDRAAYNLAQHRAKMAADPTLRPMKGKGKLTSQYVSVAVQKLIDAGVIHPDDITDEFHSVYSSRGTTDLLRTVRNYARSATLDPWAPNPRPVLIAEGANDMTVVAPIGQDRRLTWVPLGGQAGRTHLRSLLALIDHDAPVGYIGDWNKAGRDIEAAAKRFLLANGWDSTWTRLLVTEADAATMPVQMVVDGRNGQSEPSVESAAIRQSVQRQRITDWLAVLVPDAPVANDSERAAIIAMLDDMLSQR